MVVERVPSISLYKLYPGRTPPLGWSCVDNKSREEVDLCPMSGEYIRSHLQPILPSLHRDALQQASMQACMVLATLLISSVSGALAGLVIRMIGRTGSSLPVEAWYDGTCFLDTPVKSRESGCLTDSQE